MSPRRRRRLTITLISTPVVLLLVALGIYTAAAASAPLPNLQPVLTVEPTSEILADVTAAQAAVDAQALPTAVGWLHDDTVWTNIDQPQKIASLTKLVTVLTGLEAAPVAAGEDGPDYTLTSADETLLVETWADNGSGVTVPVGQTLTTRQLLQLILIPSANNYADSYARMVFGDEDAFLAAARDWLARHGLDSVHIVDPSGMSDDNVATPSDLVRLTRLALEEPIVAEIVAEASAEIPGIGLVETTNRLLGEPGIIGVKTGTTFPDGYSLSAAQLVALDDRELTAIAVTNGRTNGDDRSGNTREALAALTTARETITIGEANERVGSVTTWLGETVPLILAEPVELTLVPGDRVSRSLELTPGSLSADALAERRETASDSDAATAAAAGTPVGTSTISGPAGDLTQPIVTASALNEPDLWWRLTNPALLFGW